jgi:hypothetical protein
MYERRPDTLMLEASFVVSLYNGAKSDDLHVLYVQAGPT